MFIDTETRSLKPGASWETYTRVRYDGLVHRVVRVHQLAHFVHDEAMTTQMPVTGCGLRMSPPESWEAPRNAGFCGNDVPLSCMRCASGRPEDGDVERVLRKTQLFGAAYGKTGSVLVSSRQSGKSTYSLKALANTVLGGPMRHRVLHEPWQPQPPRLRYVLARAVWALAKDVR